MRNGEHDFQLRRYHNSGILNLADLGYNVPVSLIDHVSDEISTVGKPYETPAYEDGESKRMGDSSPSRMYTTVHREENSLEHD